MSFYQLNPMDMTSQLALLSEEDGRGQLWYYYLPSSAPSQLVVSESTNSDSRYQVLINVITGEPTYLQWIGVNTVNVCYCRLSRL